MQRLILFPLIILFIAAIVDCGFQQNHGAWIRTEFPSKSPALLPLLDGKLGAFYVTFSASDEASLGIHLYQTPQRRDYTTRMEPSDFLKLILLSLKKQGEVLGAKLKDQTLDADISFYLKEASVLPNAGLVIKGEKLKAINDWFLQYYYFRETVIGLAANAFPSMEGVYYQKFYDFAMSIGYPRKTTVANEKNGMHIEDTTWFSPDVLTTVLLRGSQWPEEKMLRLSQFQERLIFDGVFRVEHSGLRGRSSQQAAKIMYLEIGPPSWEVQILTDKGWFQGLAQNSPVWVQNSSLDDLNYLSADPRELRANLSMLLAPLPNYLGRNHRGLILMLIKSLEDKAKQWSFEVPTIENQPCHPEKPKVSTIVSLPKISSELCRSLKNNTEGIICAETGEPQVFKTKESKNSTETPVCMDANLEQNVKVTYQLRKKKTASSSGELIHIPFENFLSLFSSPYSEFPELKVSEILFSSENLESLFVQQKFPLSIAEHIVKNKMYYQNYWKAEIANFCGTLKFADSSFDGDSDRAGILGEDERTYYSKSAMSKSYYPLPSAAAGKYKNLSEFYQTLLNANLCEKSSNFNSRGNRDL